MWECSTCKEQFKTKIGLALHDRAKHQTKLTAVDLKAIKIATEPRAQT